MKKALPILLKLAVTTALLWLIFREHRFQDSILPHLRALGTHWAWGLGGLLAAGLSIWLSAVRWQVLLRGQAQEVPAAEVLRVTLVSHFFNITSLGVLGGDAYRVLALMGRPTARRLPLMVSVMLDHLLGMVGMALLFLSCRFVYVERINALSRETQALLEGFEMFMGGSLIFILLSAISFTPRLYNWGERQWPWLLGYAPLKDFATACDALRRNWRGSLWATLLSVLLFAAHFLSFHCAVRAVGGAAPLLEVMAAMPIVDTAAGLPISVSGLGVREKTFEALMHGLTGLAEATAVSASLVGWLMGVFWGLIGGVLFLRGASRTLPSAALPAET
ncbi:MAG: flippase-like domain-containing protein [Prosthecobacter sp.]|nr:flippase-like domain-containing protein [Prosthecobacter sp.]